MAPESRASIAITGVGLVTSLGRDALSTWAEIRRGSVGLGAMSDLESQPPEGAIGGQAVELPPDHMPDLPREARYLRWVIQQALGEAGSDGPITCRSDRRAVMLGTTLHGIRAGGRYLRTDDPAELRSFLASAVVRCAIDGLDLAGRVATTCSACSSSLGAIALGVTMLEEHDADLVVAGGYDAVSEYAWAGFNSLRLVSREGVMPFSRGRQGMMISEGYAVVVLEREADARGRGAKVMAVLDGWGESADAHHLTKPDPTGAGASRAMCDALARAAAGPADISMISAHGTATIDNDAAEYAALCGAFADMLPRVPVVGFKSYIGHTLGAAGAVELILSVCSMRSSFVPPCATTRQEDVEFEDLRVAPAEGIEMPVSRTLNMSLGFGGANTCVILRNPACPPHRLDADPLPRPEAWITGVGLVLPGVNSVAELLERLTADGDQFGDLAIADEQLSTALNVRRVRRLSPCTKHMLAAVSLAVRDAGIEDDQSRLQRASAILASAHGSASFCSDYYTQIAREGLLSANPILFAEGVPNSAAAHVSTHFGVRGSCQLIIGARTAGLDALALAAMRIRVGASEMVIVGAAEETHHAVDRAYRHAGLVGQPLAPGAVALIVESSASATARGHTPLARVAQYSGAASPMLALATLDAEEVLVSGSTAALVRAEVAAAHRSGASVGLPPDHLTGDLCAVTPLLMIVLSLAAGAPVRFTSLCADPTGAASAVLIEHP